MAPTGHAWAPRSSSSSEAGGRMSTATPRSSTSYASGASSMQLEEPMHKFTSIDTRYTGDQGVGSAADAPSAGTVVTLMSSPSVFFILGLTSIRRAMPGSTVNCCPANV